MSIADGSYSVFKCKRCDDYIGEEGFVIEADVCEECFQVVKMPPSVLHTQLCEFCNDRWINPDEFMCKMCLFSEQCLNSLHV